jgi:putative membrane protein
MNVIIKTFLVVSTVSVFGIVGQDQNQTTKDTTAKDTTSKSTKKWDKTKIENFVKKAASGGIMEVELGDIAMRKATSQKVKEFGNRMVTDHSKANEQLKPIAQEMNIDLSGVPEKKYKDQIQNMSEVKPENFDKEYMNLMVKDHTEDVRDFEKAQKNLPAGALKTWTSNTLVVINQHLDLAKSINDSLK